jgi:hypothetical protein
MQWCYAIPRIYLGSHMAFDYLINKHLDQFFLLAIYSLKEILKIKVLNSIFKILFIAKFQPKSKKNCFNFLMKMKKFPQTFLAKNE